MQLRSKFIRTLEHPELEQRAEDHLDGEGDLQHAQHRAEDLQDPWRWRPP